MIDPKALISYAQYNEDVILAALLHDVKKGFYIDVGANYPTIDSVTRYFYDKGWSGINIEPIESLHKELVAERPRDVNLQCGLGKVEDVVAFREYPNRPGHSTFESNQKDEHNEKHKDYDVPVTTLNKIFEEYKPPTVHFIKIDVEGFESQVVAGNDWSKNRPEIICIEASHVHDDFRPTLIKHHYKLFITDGLNEYYVAREAWKRTDGFEERAVELDYHALKQHQFQSWSDDSAELTKLHKTVRESDAQLQHLNKKLAQVEPLSLADRPFLSRLKRSLYGLTVDWLRYRKRNKS